MSGAFPSPEPPRGAPAGSLKVEFNPSSLGGGPPIALGGSVVDPRGGLASNLTSIPPASPIPTAPGVALTDTDSNGAAAALADADLEFDSPPRKWAVYAGLLAAVVLALFCFWILYWQGRGGPPPATVISVVGNKDFDGAEVHVDGKQDADGQPIHLHMTYTDNAEHIIRFYLRSGEYRLWIELPNGRQMHAQEEFDIGLNKPMQSGRAVLKMPTIQPPTTTP